MFHMMAALAEFERTVIAERTRAGLDAARQRGKKLGRPRLLSEKDLEEARRYLESENSNLLMLPVPLMSLPELFRVT